MPKAVEKIVKAIHKAHPEYPVARDWAIAWGVYKKRKGRR